MSIPKEPRQLMINLMYLVLTALLALNVSAEVMNAFFSLDKGLKSSGAIVDKTNEQILSNINKQADAYKNETNEAFRQAAIEADSITKDFSEYTQKIWDDLFAAAGGPNPKDPSKPKRKKDKDITTRMFVLGPDGDPLNKDGVGYQLEDKIMATRNALIELLRDSTGSIDSSVVASLPLNIEDWKKETAGKKSSEGKKVSWADWKFRQLPVAAVFPLLRKIQSDAKASATTVLNHLFKQVSGEELKFDAFEPVISQKKGYIIRGNKYEADIFLSAYSTSAADNTKIFVNGNNLPVTEGKATYEASASSIGTKKYKVRIDVENPLTREVKSYDKEFEYEVGERSVAVSADKMNVFYIGVPNPVSVSAAGVSSNDLRVSISGGGGSIKKISANKYEVTVNQPTNDCRINISGDGLANSKVFRVKRIPDPVARLGNKPDGSMGNGEFKVQKGLIAWLDNFDFDAKCQIQGFTLVRAAKRQDPVESVNRGGTYNQKSKRYILLAKPGDIYYYDNVKARCPGDKAGRRINSMVFRIK